MYLNKINDKKATYFSKCFRVVKNFANRMRVFYAWAQLFFYIGQVAVVKYYFPFITKGGIRWIHQPKNVSD